MIISLIIKEKEEPTVCEAFDKLINEGIISMLKDMIASGDITMEIAAKQMKVTVEEFENMIKEE